MNNAITRPVGWIGDSIDRNTRRTVNGLRLLSGLDRPRTGCTIAAPPRPSGRSPTGPMITCRSRALHSWR